MLISWKRLLGGAVLDPLVGRDLLLGTVAGLAMAAATRAWSLVPGALGLPPPPPDLFVDGTTLTALRHAGGGRLFVNAFSGVLYALVFLFILVLLRVVTRSQWVAAPLWCLLLASPFRSGDPTLIWLEGAFRAVTFYLLLTRAGLLALASALFVMFVIFEVPLTLEVSAWYASRAGPVVLVFAALLAYAFHTSLGGKPIFGGALLDD